MSAAGPVGSAMRTLLTSGCAALLVAALAGQATSEPARPQRVPPARITGRVTGSDGKPWVGATVVIRHWGPSGGGKTERLTTDERGGFEVAARPLRSYQIFAHTAVIDGRYRATSSQTATAGSRVLLTEQGERTQLAVRVQGLEAWRDAKLRFFHVEEVAPDAEGRFVLPANAERSATLSIVDTNGIVVYLASFLGSSTDRVWDLELPPPRDAVLRVMSADGKPIAGATLEPYVADWGGVRRAIDADGLRFRVPATAIDAQSISLSSVRLNVVAPGHTHYAHVGWSGRVPIDGDGVVQLRLPMQPGSSWTGRLLSGPDQPARRAKLLQWVSIEQTWDTSEGGEIGGSPRTLATDDAGHFTTLGCRAPASALAVEVGDVLAATLPSSPDFPTAPVAYLRALTPAPVPPAGPSDLGDLRLDRLLPLDIEIIHPDGAPARHATLVVAIDDAIWSRLRLVANERGRLRVFVPPNRQLAMAARLDSAIGSLDCSVDRAQHLTLRLEPRLWIAGTVRRRDGKPLPDVSLFVNFEGDSGAGTKGRERLAMSLEQRGATSDAAGKFHVGSLEPGRTVHLFCTHGTWAGADFVKHTESLSLGEEPLNDVEIVMPTAAPTPPVKK